MQCVLIKPVLLGEAHAPGKALVSRCCCSKALPPNFCPFQHAVLVWQPMALSTAVLGQWLQELVAHDNAGHAAGVTFNPKAKIERFAYCRSWLRTTTQSRPRCSCRWRAPRASTSSTAPTTGSSACCWAWSGTARSRSSGALSNLNQLKPVFLCLLLGLEWHRAQQEFRFAAAAAGLPPMLLSGCLVGSSGTARSRCTEAELAFPFVSRRLYFEARGETDLRHPSASSVGYTVHRGGGGGADDRRRLQERLQQLQARCGLL